MGTFKFSGGVEVTGFISPTKPTDDYPVIDPLYGIDGFRNVNTINELNLIPELRRRAGMVVGVSGGTNYYKLNPEPWSFTFTDWSNFTPYDPSLDVYVTGSTLSSASLNTNLQTSTLLYHGNALGGPHTILTQNTFTTGGTFNNNSALITFKRNDGSSGYTVDLSSLDLNDTYTTGFTYNSNTFTLSDNSGNTFNATINTVTGLTVNGLLNVNGISVTGDTFVTGGTYVKSANTITLYSNNIAPIVITGITTDDYYTTGFTYNNNTFKIFDNSGNTFDATINTVTGLTVNGTLNVNGISVTGDTFVTGGTYTKSANTITLFNNNIPPIDITGITTDDYYTTGFTYSANTFTLSDNSGNTFNATINNVTGLTINGVLNVNGVSVTGDTFVTGGTYVKSANTITLYSNNIAPIVITGITTDDFYVTGGTFNDNTKTLTLKRNDNGVIAVTGFTDIFTTGFTFNPSNYDISIKLNDNTVLTQNLSILSSDVNITGGTYDPLNGSVTFTNNTGGTFSVSGFITGFTDIQVTAFTYNDNVFTITDSTGNTFNATLNKVTGLTVNGNFNVTGQTNLNNLSISGNGYYNNIATGSSLNEIINYKTLTSYTQTNDVYVTGNTYVSATNNTNQTTFNLLYHSSPLGGPYSLNGKDTFTTGGTYNNSNALITFKRNDGSTGYTVDLSSLDLNDTYVTGGTLSLPTNTTNLGSINLRYNQDVPLLTYSLPYTDTFITGFTYNNNTFSLYDNSGNTFTQILNTVTGLTVNGNLSVTGNTNLNNLTATTISATTYQNLPTDIRVTGATYNNNTFTYTNNTGGTFSVLFNTVTGLTVNGNLNISGNTSQVGNYNLTGNTNQIGNFTITGNTTQSGSTTQVGNFNITGNTNINGSLVVQSGLTANTIYTDYVDFNQNYTGATTQGRINWDTGTGTLNIGVGDTGTGLIDLQVGQEEVVRVYNDAGSTLLKGEIVYVSGAQGNRPSVKRALATSDGYSVTTLGMVDRDISAGAEGYVTTFGIISNLNTLGLTGGTAIFLSPTVAGGYTSIKPQAPQHIVLIGYVVRVSATVGSIFINISNGWELDELHDVRITNPTDGDLLIRSTYSGSPVWINSKILSGNYTISGNTSLIGNFNVTGNTSQSGNTTQIGNYHITGNTSQQGIYTHSGNTFITGNTNQIGNYNTTGNTTQYGNIYLSGTSLSGQCALEVHGNVCIDGDVNISGDTFMSGDFCMNNMNSGGAPTGTNCLDTNLIPTGVTVVHQFQGEGGVLAHLDDLATGEPNSKGYIYMQNNLSSTGTTILPTNSTTYIKMSGATSTIPAYLNFFTTGSSFNELVYTYTASTGNSITYLKYNISYTATATQNGKRTTFALVKSSPPYTATTVVPAAMTNYMPGQNQDVQGTLTGIVGASYLDRFSFYISNSDAANTYGIIVSDFTMSLFT